jgi:hypothetical protein
MSADNGIYILKTKDGQYRVAHAQAIENIYEGYSGRRYDSLQVVLTWMDCRYTRDFEKAMIVANAMENKWHTEYGIRVFTYNKTWKHIVEDAKKMAEINLKAITEDGFYERHISNKYNKILKM